MNRLLTSLLCALGALCLPTLASLPEVDFSGSGVTLEVSRTSPEHTTISLHSPNVAVTAQALGYETGQMFSIAGEPLIPDEGSPSVPQISRFYRVPNTGGVDLNLEELGFDLMESVHPVPYHDGDGDAVENAEVYARDAWYPVDVAMMSAPMQMRDFRVVQVTLHPVQVNPVTHQARIYHTIDVSLSANSQPGVCEITHPRRPSGAWAPIYRSMIANLDDGALDDMTTTPGSYMIICKNNPVVLPFVDSLRIWKTRCGYQVVVASNDQWTPEGMISAIRTQFAQTDFPLEFVCLMGDPAASFGVPTDGGSDFGFALGNSQDDLEDIGVGRLSGINQGEMATINAKIMSYERHPHMVDGQGHADTTWFHKAFLYATVGMCESNLVLMNWANNELGAWTGFNHNIVETADGGVIPGVVEGHIAGGVGLFVWRGCWMGQMDNGLAGSCASGWRLPVCVTVTCGSNNYEYESGVAESYLTAGTPSTPAGGVCGIGTEGYGTHTLPNNTFVRGLLYGLANMGVEHVGTMMSVGRYELGAVFGVGSDYQTEFSTWNNLMGEPGLAVWTDVPRLLTVEYPDTLTPGLHTVALTVRDAGDLPLADAMVVLWKNDRDSILVRGKTNAQGQIQFPVTLRTEGDVWLTVTKRGCKPELMTIPCTRATHPLGVSATVVDDDRLNGTQGNGDGIPNPDEIIDLSIYLKNYGTSSIGGVFSAQLESLTSQVTLLSDTSSYPDLAPGDSARPLTPFRMHLLRGIGHGEALPLQLTATLPQGQAVISLELTGQAGRVEFVSGSASDLMEPGETVNFDATVRNGGGQRVTGVTARLVSLTPWITVGDSVGTFGDIAVGQQATNLTDEFALTVRADAYPGAVVPLMLIAAPDSGRHADTSHFTVTLGSLVNRDPCGPDAYGYYAYENTDTGYSLHPLYNYVDIAASGGQRTLPLPILSVSDRLPFPVTYYGHRYDSISYNFYGWIAFGAQSDLEYSVPYELSAMLAPNAMIAPYWQTLGWLSTSGLWTMNDAAHHRYILQWKGMEPTGQDSVDFEVILYDSVAFPTSDGNTAIEIQYRHVAIDLSGSRVIGMQSPRGDIAFPLQHGTEPVPGMVGIDSGRAILITTEGRPSPLRGTHLPSPAEMPTSYRLYQNYPNPFNPQTEIRFDLPKDGHVRLGIYNALGQEIVALLDDRRSAGTYTVTWDGRSTATGLYFCRLEVGEFAQTRKMLLMK